LARELILELQVRQEFKVRCPSARAMRSYIVGDASTAEFRAILEQCERIIVEKGSKVICRLVPYVA